MPLVRRQDLPLVHFGEIEFGFVKGLQDGVHAELCGVLFAVAPLVVPGPRTLSSRNHLGRRKKEKKERKKKGVKKCKERGVTTRGRFPNSPST